MQLQPATTAGRPGTDGEVRVVATRSGSATVELRGLALASRIDPDAEARSLATGLAPTTEWIWLGGWGSGHLARAVLDRCPRAELLVFEPSPEVLATARSHPLLGRGLGDPRVTVSTDPFELRFAFEARFLPGASLATLIVPPYGKLFARELRDLGATLNQSRARVEANVLSRLALSGVWLDHLLSNLPQVATQPSLSDLADRFRGKPAICVAAGPSLDRNIDVLREAGDRALVIAAGSALKPLRARGIRPHMTVAIEWRDSVLQQFGDVSLDGIHLLLSAVSHPRLFGLGSARTWIELPGSSPASTWVGETLNIPHEFSEGGSVAHTVYSTAWLLGCDPIVLVGQDLALGPAGRTHSALSVHGHIHAPPADANRDPASERPRYVLPGYHGGEVETLREFYCYHAWFEDRFRTDAAQRTIVNATEGGARIRGTVQRPLAEVVAEMASGLDADAILAAVPAPDASTRARTLAAGLRGSRSSIREAGTLASDALAVIDSTEKVLRRDPTQVGRLLERLDRLERDLAPLLDSDPFIRSLTAPAVYRTSRARAEGPPPGSEEALGWSLEQSRLLHRAVRDAARTLLPRLEQVISALEPEASAQ